MTFQTSLAGVILMTMFLGCAGENFCRVATTFPASTTIRAQSQNQEPHATAYGSYRTRPPTYTSIENGVRRSSVEHRKIRSDQQPLVNRPLSLRDAIYAAMQQSEIIRVLNGGVSIESTTGFDPLIADTDYRATWTRFDPRIKSGYIGSQINTPPSSFFGPGIETQTRRDEGDFIASLDKSWSTGAETSISYAPPLGYLFIPGGSTGQLNPAYTSDLIFEMRQPLLRGGGTVVNMAPIQVAKIRVDQTDLDVREKMISQVRSIEQAYWQLQSAHMVWQSIDEVIPLAQESIRIEELRLKAERNIYADVARAKVKLESLIQQRLWARQTVRDREFELRQIIGLPANDGQQLIPISVPDNESPDFDIDMLTMTALEMRPDLKQRRLEIVKKEVELQVAENAIYPQLDAFGNYRTSGLASRLDSSLSEMSDFKYSSWTLGMEFSVPLGNRKSIALAEQKELQLARERALLVSYENQITYVLSELTTEIQTAWGQFQSSLRQSQYAREWLRLSRIRYASPRAASRNQDSLLIALQDYQTSMQSYIEALSNAGESLAKYNTLRARLDEELGILLDKWQVTLASEEDEGSTFRDPSMFNHLANHLISESTADTYASRIAEKSNVFGHAPMTDPFPVRFGYSAPVQHYPSTRIGYGPSINSNYHQNSVRR